MIVNYMQQMVVVVKLSADSLASAGGLSMIKGLVKRTVNYL